MLAQHAKKPRFDPQNHKTPGIVVHVHDPSSQEVNAHGLEIKFIIGYKAIKASVDYMRIFSIKYEGEQPESTFLSNDSCLNIPGKMELGQMQHVTVNAADTGKK